MLQASWLMKVILKQQAAQSIQYRINAGDPSHSELLLSYRNFIPLSDGLKGMHPCLFIAVSHRQGFKFDSVCNKWPLCEMQEIKSGQIAGSRVTTKHACHQSVCTRQVMPSITYLVSFCYFVTTLANTHTQTYTVHWFNKAKTILSFRPENRSFSTIIGRSITGRTAGQSAVREQAAQRTRLK